MPRDRRSAIGLAIFAVAYLLGDRRYPLDTLATPGPGLFPLVAGLALLALAIWQFTVARPRPERESPHVAGVARVADTQTFVGSPLVMAGVLVVYAALFPLVGFFATSLALVFISSRLMRLAGWWRPAALALGITVVSRVIFVTWLGVPLP